MAGIESRRYITGLGIQHGPRDLVCLPPRRHGITVSTSGTNGAIGEPRRVSRATSRATPLAHPEALLGANGMSHPAYSLYNALAYAEVAIRSCHTTRHRTDGIGKLPRCGS